MNKLKSYSYLSEQAFNSIYPEVEEVIKILAKIIITTKQKQNNPTTHNPLAMQTHSGILVHNLQNGAS
ncbi:hypothetical protein C7N43_09925 [Sphingobacteriales bacterium UPWRP_1]|nr:hypothetical protein C7N43_09925 [Sphingobacteriales bacterium UPWRP_1]